MDHSTLHINRITCIFLDHIRTIQNEGYARVKPVEATQVISCRPFQGDAFAAVNTCRDQSYIRPDKISKPRKYEKDKLINEHVCK